MATTPLVFAIGCRAILGVHDYDDAVASGDASPADGSSLLGEASADGAPCLAAPADPLYLSNATQVVAGLGFSCALLDDGSVACWGDDTHGQLGNGLTSGAYPTPMKIDLADAGVGSVTQLAAGDAFACALDSAGVVSCWGANDSNQLGRAGFDSDKPLPVKSGASNLHFSSIAAGGAHACGIIAGEDLLACWGANDSGQLGIAGDAGAKIVQLPTSSSPTTLALGDLHSCLLSGSTVTCWGSNESGQIAVDSKDAASWLPASAFPSFPEISNIRAGGHDTCATTPNGIYCVGANNTKQLGSASIIGSVIAPQPLDFIDASDVALGGTHACGWSAGGQLFCEGDDKNGELGFGSVSSDAAAPVYAVSGIDGGGFGPVLGAAVAGPFFALGQSLSQDAGPKQYPHSCAILDRGCGISGTVYCWGSNQSGEVGMGDAGSDPVLAPVPVLAAVP